MTTVGEGSNGCTGFFSLYLLHKKVVQNEVLLVFWNLGKGW